MQNEYVGRCVYVSKLAVVTRFDALHELLN
jgi:hypothetical protein